jgi:hypothetical protein
MTIAERRIQDAILTSAKQKIDYKTMLDKFSPVNPDRYLEMVIEYYAKGEKKDLLALKLSREISLENYECTLDNAEIFINNTVPLLEKEIYAKKNATEMLDKKIDPDAVLLWVVQFLKS